MSATHPEETKKLVTNCDRLTPLVHSFAATLMIVTALGSYAWPQGATVKVARVLIFSEQRATRI